MCKHCPHNQVLKILSSTHRYTELCCKLPERPVVIISRRVAWKICESSCTGGTKAFVHLLLKLKITVNYIRQPHFTKHILRGLVLDLAKSCPVRHIVRMPTLFLRTEIAKKTCSTRHFLLTQPSFDGYVGPNCEQLKFSVITLSIIKSLTYSISPMPG